MLPWPPGLQCLDRILRQSSVLNGSGLHLPCPALHDLASLGLSILVHGMNSRQMLLERGRAAAWKEHGLQRDARPVSPPLCDLGPATLSAYLFTYKMAIKLQTLWEIFCAC